MEQQLRKLPEQFEIDVSADLTPLQRKLEKARKEEEAKQLNLKVGVEYDSIAEARQKVQAALKQVQKTVSIPVKMNEEDLNKALQKLDRLRRSAKVTMEISEDTQGYAAVLAKIRAIQREKLAKTITFKTDNKSLEAEARKYEKLLADLAPAKTITLTHRNDHESLTKAVAQIDEALAKLKEIKITPQMNEEELLKQKDRLQRKLATKPLVMKVNEDKASYEAVLAKVQALQKEAAATEFKFKTDEAGLAAAATKLKAKIALLTPKPTVKFSYDNDTFGLEGAIKEVDAKIKALGQITLTADMDEESLLKAKDELEAQLATSKFEIAVDSNNLDKLKAERKKLEDMISSKWNMDTVISVENSPEDMERAKAELDELIKKREAPIKADPITWEAAMQLAYASRARIVPFYVRINERSLAIAEGVLKSLAGINVLQSTGRWFESLVTKFDQVSIKAGALLTIIGGLADATAYLGTTLFAMGEGVFNVVGLTATLPTAMAATTAMVLVNIAAWKGFGDAVDGSAEALAKLPPEARRTAQSLKGVWDSIQDPVQDSFWHGVGNSMETALAMFIPAARRGLTGLAGEMGEFTAGLFRGLEKASGNGDIDKMFANLEQGMDKATGAAEPLMDAINRLGLRGSEYLPRFGTWLTDITVRFDEWLRKADEAGKINIWIEQGVQSLKDMFTLTGGVAKMFQGIGVAAEKAGAGGLGDVAQRFSEIGDMMLREPFQSRLSRIFDGARHGASELNKGVKELGLTIGEASLFTANFLAGLGQLGGQTLVGLSKTIGNLEFQSGLLAGLTGMNQMVVTLHAGFTDLGSIIGNLSRIAGAAFTSIAPVLNQLVSTLNIVVGTLTPSLLSTIPGLMGLVGGLIQSLSGPVELVAQALATVLDFINGLGGPLQSLGLSMIGFLLLAGKIGPLFQAKPGGLLEKIKYDFQQADTARGKFQAGLKGIGAGMLGAVGGPWGLAIGAVTTGLALAGQASADAKSRIDAYTESLDENTGAITRNTKAQGANNLLDEGGFWNDRLRGVKKTQESLDILGQSFQEAAEKAVAGGPGYDELMSKLERFPGISGQSGATMASFASSMGITEEEAKKLSRGDIQHLIKRLQEVNTESATGRENFGHLNDRLDTTDQRTRDLNAAMGTYNDKTATADQRTRALKTALDILNGKQPSIEEAQLKVNDAMRALDGELQNVDGNMVKVGGAFRDAQGNVKNFTGVIDAATGKINTQSEAGASLYRATQQATDGVLATATAMKDAKRPAEEISRYLADQRQRYIDMGVAAGLNGETVALAYDRMIGANPGNLITTITAQGVEGAEGQIRSYQDLLNQIDGRKAVATIAGDNTALGTALGLSYTSLAAWDKAVATATVGLDPAQALAVRQDLEDKLITLANSNPTVKANLDPELLNRREAEVSKTIEELAKKKPTPEVDAEIMEAQRKLNIVQNLLASLKDKTVKVNTNFTYTREPGNESANGSIQDGRGRGMYGFHPKYFADGGFFQPVQQFANGGVSRPRENHVAQIARGGTPYRVWAEPETGGEAYIPLSVAKRGRSTQILAQVAQQFGFSLKKATAFADGGIVTSDRTGGGVSLTIGNYTTNASDTPDDVARALMRKVKTAGVYTPLEGF